MKGVQFWVKPQLFVVEVLCVEFYDGGYTISWGGVAQEPDCVAFVGVGLAIWYDELLDAMEDNDCVLGGYR